MLQGFYLGALLALTLYNLMVWVSSRDRGFGLYTFYAACSLCWSFTYDGFGAAWFWPDSPLFDNRLLPIAAALSLAGFAAIGQSYLRLATPGAARSNAAGTGGAAPTARASLGKACHL